MELAEILPALVVVEALHVVVEPHLAPAERGTAESFERDVVDGELGEQVAPALTALDEDFAEIFLKRHALELRVGAQRHLDNLCLAVAVGSEVEHLGAGRAEREVVFAVVGYGSDVEAFEERAARLAVAINGIIDSALVASLEHVDVYDAQLFVLLSRRAGGAADKHLFLHARDFIGAVGVEDNHVVDGRAVGHELVLFQPRAHKAVGAVDVEFLVGLDDFRGFDVVERADFRFARELVRVFILNQLIPVGSDAHHIGKVAVDTRHLVLHASDEFVGLVLVEFQNTRHADFHKAENVVLGHLADKLRVERREALVDMRAGGVHIFRVLKGPVLIDTLLDEYLFQRGEVQAFQQFAAADKQFLAQQILGALHAAAQHVAHGEELGALLVDDAAVGRDRDLAVGKGVKRVDRLVARRAGREVHQYFHAGGRVVVHLADFDFPLVVGFENAVDQARGGLAEGDFADSERLVVDFLNLGAYFHVAAAHTIVVARHVDAAAREEVGVKAEWLSVQVADGGIAELTEVVRQDFCRKPHGNAFRALRQQ